jgi:zinc transport system substrate-binding protein
LALVVGAERAAVGQTASKAEETPVIYTTFYPTTYFAQRIGGDRVKVVCPCPTDADPATWMPDDKTIEAYQRADLIVINGATFEKWVAKATLPDSRIVDTSKPLKESLIELKRGVTHTHGPTGKHTHHGIDGHTWVDPGNAKIQGAEIKKALVKSFPEHKDAFEQGYAALAKDLDALDARLKAVSERIGDQQLLCNHPAYNYLARHYGWRLEVFYLEPEGATDAEELEKVGAFVKDQPARYLLWESEPTEEIARKMSGAFGLESIVFSPCETLDDVRLKAGEDFLTVMNANVDRLEQAFAAVAPEGKP